MSRNLKAGEYFGKVSNNRATTSAVFLEVFHKRGKTLPTHSHERGFFSFLLNGSYSETFSGKSFEYGPITLWWHRPGVVHQDEVGVSGGHFFNIEIQPDCIEELKDLIRLPDDFYVRCGPLVWSAFRLYHEVRNWQTGTDLIAEGITLEMLGYSARDSLAKGRPPLWLKRVLERLNEDLSSNFTVKELAKDVGVHPVHLTSVFRKFQRQTIGDYVRNRRLSRAMQMLSDREISLSEIAVSVGFFDQSHFSRVFKSRLGLTPAIFRRTLIENKL